MTELSTSDQLAVLQHLPRRQAVSTFQYLLPRIQERLFESNACGKAAAILNEMSPMIDHLVGRIKRENSKQMLERWLQTSGPWPSRFWNTRRKVSGAS